MWYFLTEGATSPASRIEFLFEQIAAVSNVSDQFATFHFYNDRFNAVEVAAED
jgi:hypothetical protein